MTWSTRFLTSYHQNMFCGCREGKPSRSTRGQAGHNSWWIGSKNTNLADDVDILSSEEVKHFSQSKSRGPPLLRILEGPPPPPKKKNINKKLWMWEAVDLPPVKLLQTPFSCCNENSKMCRPIRDQGGHTFRWIGPNKKWCRELNTYFL